MKSEKNFNINWKLIDILRKTTRVAVLTGAGISAESGLKTFRESQDGHWSQYRPEDLATPQAFERDPNLVWDWYAMRRRRIAEASPNPGHYALVEMEKHFRDFSIITQNIDGYHVQAGSKQVLELHGNIQRVKCLDGCGVVDGWEKTAPSRKGGRGTNVPRCPKCEAHLRPDVVWFGESLPRTILENALSAAQNCQVFFSIGTSALVQPAASLAQTARQNNAVTVEINLDPTPLTSQVHYAFIGKSGKILPALVRRVWDTN